MKADIHPKEYRPVLFVDNSSGAEFLVSSTIPAKETKKAKDGKEYPVHFVEISSASHPFYTNQEKIVDTAGRVEKFKVRATKSTAAKAKKSAETAAAKA